ncbi:RNA-guided endonuclease InsQ/TnpB family protein [Butyricicoccus sp.]|uniref:RNA-guided endonuclease InsQ/TnpB family protein n=1 Tax=Butyricicoccus sp. TaxID=2049021 RepID=UPI003F16E496
MFKIKLTNVAGPIKVRGWNERIRFGEHQEYNFVEWMERQSARQRITVTISKDACGDYYICFKLSGKLAVWKPMKEPTKNTVGIDIGIKAAVITSDGEKFENRKYKQREEERLAALNRRLIRRNGYANIKFRERAKLFQEQGLALPQSNRYRSTQIALAKAHRKVTRKRIYHNNNTTTTLVSSYQGIGVESLNVSGMMHNKHLAKSIADVAFSTILEQIKYKSDWYQRTCVPINQFFPSSKKCHNCGFIFHGLTLSMRDWTCPRCQTHHDRDINAAINIRMEVFNENSNVSTINV